jgi:hypothetical protein
MTLTLEKVSSPGLCEGSEWIVADEEALAEHVARVAVGQYRHVAKILLGEGAAVGTVTRSAKADAITLLTLKRDEEPWHRDGWLFQAISWIAAHNSSGVAIRAPHLIKAHKGFDGLKLELSADAKVTAVVIFEDKATERPRDTIRDDVWPGIAKLEKGERTNELSQEVSSLLEAQLKTLPDLDVDAAVQQIVWNEARRYRIAITVEEPHATAEKRKRLFKDYDAYAPGDVVRRGAETMCLPDLRSWMQSFADKVIAKINALPDNV